jgi:hypothetical protein
MIQPAIDYDAVRVALIRTVEAALGLDSQSVVMAEPEQADAPRPSLPYLTLKNAVTSQRYGWDMNDVQDDGSTVVTQGPRSFDTEFTAYGRTHEEAAGLMATWQAALQSWPVQERLRAAGIAAWKIGDVADVSALLDTGYEGRTSLKVTFGIVSYLSVGSGANMVIDSATITGDVSGNPVEATASAETNG